jgi:hypothetical protein
MEVQIISTSQFCHKCDSFLHCKASRTFTHAHENAQPYWILDYITESRLYLPLILPFSHKKFSLLVPGFFNQHLETKSEMAAVANRI